MQGDHFGIATLCARIEYEVLTMISSMSFNDSSVLIKCFRLALNRKLFEKLYLGTLRSVVPPYMSCIGKNLLVYVMTRVAMMACL